MRASDFNGSGPRFVVEEYFAGETRAWGIFEDRFGNLRRQFEVDIKGSWDGRELVLDEHFDYADGERDRRVWTITKLDDHTYEGRADDVVGTARGESYGNALNWRYDMNLKVGERTFRVRFDDWMFLQPSRILINKARVSKFGVALGEVTLVFMKPEKATQIIGSSVNEQPDVRELAKAANQ